jgi:hypothetical protein
MYADESMVFYNILMAIFHEYTTGKDPAELNSAVQMLKRSKGQQPPKQK